MFNLKLEAPWYTFQKKVFALFKDDPEIIVGPVYSSDRDDAQFAFDIEVKKHDKFIALDRVMPSFKMFGNVKLEIVLYDEENVAIKNGTELFETIFRGNGIVKDFKNVTDQAGTVHSFVRFQHDVIQFFDDDITDYNGNWSGLAEDIARDVFEGINGVNFCTAAVDEDDNGVDVNKPLGEWP